MSASASAAGGLATASDLGCRSDRGAGKATSAHREDRPQRIVKREGERKRTVQSATGLGYGSARKKTIEQRSSGVGVGTITGAPCNLITRIESNRPSHNHRGSQHCPTWPTVRHTLARVSSPSPSPAPKFHHTRPIESPQSARLAGSGSGAGGEWGSHTSARQRC